MQRLTIATEGILAWLNNVDTRKWTAQRLPDEDEADEGDLA